MKPWMHAERSLREMGGTFEDHLASHAFLDRTKDAYAQISHRFLLHSSDFGARALKAARPDGPDATALVAIHLRDDLGGPATMSDWLMETRPELLPSVRGGPLAGLTATQRAQRLTARFGLPDNILAMLVCDFLDTPDELAPEAAPAVRGLALRNSFGIGLAEACLGAVHHVGNRRIGVRDLAEAEVLGVTGTILAYASVAKAVRLRSWMSGDRT